MHVKLGWASPEFHVPPRHREDNSTNYMYVIEWHISGQREFQFWIWLVEKVARVF